MKILIFGATGQTGRLAAQQAVAAGHEVTVFVRDPAKFQQPGVRVIKGDAMQAQDVAAAVAGQDAVISTLGGTTPYKVTHLEDTAMRNIVAAMKAGGVRRLVAISMMGVGTSKAQAPFLYRNLLMPTFLRGTTVDKTAMEREMTASGLDYVIARAPMLKNAPATGNVVVLQPQRTGHDITRADLAAFLVAQTASNDHLRQAVTVVNR